MDPVCHTLVGASLAEAGLKRRTGYAVPTLLLAANLPDVDALAMGFGDGLGFRRGWTHGVLALAVWPVLLTAAMLLWARHSGAPSTRHPAPVPRQLLLLSALGVLTHPFLDYLNNYGIRWLMPFRDRWFYGDTLFIVDPWVWIALGLGVYVSRRRERAGSLPPGRPARVALALVTAYIGLMMGSTVLGRHIVGGELTKSGERPPRYMVTPRPVNPLGKQIVVDEGRRYRLGRIRLGLEPVVDWGRVVEKGDGTPAVQRVRALPAAKPFLHWARLPVFLERASGDSTVVGIYDLRYASGTGPSWAMVEFTVPTTAPPAAPPVRSDGAAPPVAGSPPPPARGSPSGT